MSSMGWLRQFRTVAALGIATASVAALSGCTTATASELPMPDVVWEGGEPSGDVWDSHWAQAYIEASMQTSLARVYGDYSDPSTVAALGYEGAVKEASILSDVRFSGLPLDRQYFGLLAEYAFYGTILDIEESSDGNSARIQACELGVRGHDATPFSMEWIITLHPSGGYSTEHEWGVNSLGDCPSTPPWTARWAEPIDLDSITRDSMKMPLPRDYYVDLGVISQ